MRDLWLEELLRVILVTSPLAKSAVDDRWAAATANTYNDIKHADRPAVDMPDAYQRLNDSIKVFRCWTHDRLTSQ